MGDVTENTRPNRPSRSPIPRADRIRNVVVQVWEEWASAEGVQKTRELVRAAHRDYPGKVAILVRVVAGCRVPDPRTMRSFARFLRDVESEVKGVGMVFEGDGFWSATMRTLVSSVTLVARSAPPTRCYEDLHEASDAICDLLGQHDAALVSPETLVAAAASLDSPEN